MKTLVLKSAIVLVLLSSCSTHKSFLHQRYTSYGHKKHHTETSHTGSVASAHKAAKTVEAAPIADQPVLPEPVKVAVAQPELAAQKNVLTASAAPGMVHQLLATPKAIKLALTGHQATSLQKSTKTLNKQSSNQAKHGLLFGVIDAILAIVLSVIFVGLIVLLVLVLI